MSNHAKLDKTIAFIEFKCVNLLEQLQRATLIDCANFQLLLSANFLSYFIYILRGRMSFIQTGNDICYKLYVQRTDFLQIQNIKTWNDILAQKCPKIILSDVSKRLRIFCVISQFIWDTFSCDKMLRQQVEAQNYQWDIFIDVEDVVRTKHELKYLLRRFHNLIIFLSIYLIK